MVLRHGPPRPTQTSMADQQGARVQTSRARRTRIKPPPGAAPSTKPTRGASAHITSGRAARFWAWWRGQCNDEQVITSRFKATVATTAAVMPVPETMEEERYVQVASRFFRVKPGGGGGDGCTASLHYLGSCFLCKESIACNRDVFMYKGDAAFCSDDCRQEQMAMDEALDAVARRHRLLRAPPPPSSSPAGEAPSSSRPLVMRRRPTIANLAARNHPVAAS
ncbi:uncharacterized protein [Setaria viridis]|uniref:FLZ-type domain-containing protein n=1 Tax=Setaria viridis TaxID=4556 RepID=A0A4U6V341_SETVI|nr:uncharacterized protein LOC117851242 [Setaria viridis]TKW23428.1 hypothetical protein SEVIR_4G291400v2 [Setaria viridis]